MRSKRCWVAGQYADKAVNMGSDAISLDKTETDIVAEIDFWYQTLDYEMSFETMVLTGNNAANHTEFLEATKSKTMLSCSLTLVTWQGNGYASDMTRTVAGWKTG